MSSCCFFYMRSSVSPKAPCIPCLAAPRRVLCESSVGKPSVSDICGAAAHDEPIVATTPSPQAITSDMSSSPSTTRCFADGTSPGVTSATILSTGADMAFTLPQCLPTYSQRVPIAAETIVLIAAGCSRLSATRPPARRPPSQGGLFGQRAAAGEGDTSKPVRSEVGQPTWASGGFEDAWPKRQTLLTLSAMGEYHH